jgi:hypothetical protein
VKHFITFLITFCCVSSITFSAAHPSYAASLIPEELRKDANAVIRMQTDRMQITQSHRALFFRHIVMTVLNQAGSNMGYEKIFYSQFEKIKNISGNLYDKNGEFVRTLTSSDIEDYSVDNSVSGFDDVRVKVAGLRNQSYPYTVELIYEMVHSGIIMIPVWTPVSEQHVSVEKAEYFFSTANKIECHYQQSNILNFSGVKQSDDNILYHWTLEKFPAQKYEPFSPPLSHSNPHVTITLSKFKIEQYEGEGTNWNSLGTFVYNLNSNRDELTEDIFLEVRKITLAIATRREKIKALYDYLQQTTRYVNISLGIGGWQTHEAKYVCKNKYGDCKALTNYMKSMLKAANIESYQALINSGEDANATAEDFPSLHFNHVILFVPDDKDTIWLECTSQRMPFGVLSNSCEDRWALALHANQSRLIRTPKSSPADNTITSSAWVRLNKDGSAACKMTLKFKGTYANEVKISFIDKSRKEQEQWLTEMLQLPSVQIHEYSINDLKSTGEVELGINADIPQYGSTSATKIFIYLNLLSKEKWLPEPGEQRKENVVSNLPFTSADTIVYELPAGVKIESVKQDSSDVKSDFGSYYSFTSSDALKNTITYIRTFSMNRFNFPPDKYEGLRAFFAGVVKKDQAQAILTK